MILAGTTYTHQALFYETDHELVDGLARFVTEGIEAGDRVVVVVSAAVGALLGARLGSTDGFDLADSVDVYTSPVRTLAGYVEAVRAGTEEGRSMRVAGQPIWAGLSPLATAEWSCVEAACNEVFADSRLLMLCPYDIARTDPSVIAAARRTHPEVRSGRHVSASPEFSPVGHQTAVRASELPPRPPSASGTVVAAATEIETALAFVDSVGVAHGAAASRLTDLRTAVAEVVAEAVEVGGGAAEVHVWATAEELVVEVVSSGVLTTPFAGYLPPAMTAAGERGLWSAGQRCDLMAVRELGGGTTIRLHVADYLVSARPGCEGIDELLGVFALGGCDPAEAAAVEGHLVTCADCRAESARLAQVVRSMNESHGDVRSRDDM